MQLPPASTILVAACGLHLGFQLVVTGLVYPALASTPAAQWSESHAAHSRRITPLVVLVYGAVVLAGAAVLRAGASGPEIVSVAAATAAILVTARRAAPLHARLAERPLGRRSADLRRLVAADRARTLLAALAAVAALVG